MCADWGYHVWLCTCILHAVLRVCSADCWPSSLLRVPHVPCLDGHASGPLEGHCKDLAATQVQTVASHGLVQVLIGMHERRQPWMLLPVGPTNSARECVECTPCAGDDWGG